jgi:hypothetical protein
MKPTAPPSSRRTTYWPVALLSLVAWSSLPAQSPLASLPTQELIRFFEATGGDQWLRNDGWGDPNLSPCEWYGVECNFALGALVVNGISLSGNGLQGSLRQSGILSIELERLDLSNNRLHGELPALPATSQSIDLSGNALSGPLPLAAARPPDGIIFPGAPITSTLQFLDLSDNAFTGAIPNDWGDAFSLAYLDLSGNAIDASMERAFQAMAGNRSGELDLSDNRFDGSLPAFVTNTELAETDTVPSGGGLNLCWNDLDIRDRDSMDYLDRHHVGGESWRHCLQRDRSEIDPGVSGSWFSPQRTGEGLSLMLLASGQPLVYAFTYDPQGRQQWYFEVGRRDDLFLDWPNLLETRGDFGSGLRLLEGQPALRSAARLRLDRLSDGELLMERVYFDYSDCPSFNGTVSIAGSEPIPCPFSPFSDRIEQIQLSRLAGSRCDNQQPQQWISGAWFDPSRSGEGFVVEVIEDGRGVVYWFTYSAAGSGRQAWFTADGSFDGNTLHIENLLQPIGARSGTGFDASQLELRDWGRLTLEFNENDQGLARFESGLANFGSGEFPLQRLARPMLADCD